MSPPIRELYLKESVLKILFCVKMTVKHYWFYNECWEPFLLILKNIWSGQMDMILPWRHAINSLSLSASSKYKIPPTLVPTLVLLLGTQVCPRLASSLHIVICLSPLLLLCSLLLLSACPVKLHLQRSPNQICTSGGQFVRAVCGLIDSKA